MNQQRRSRQAGMTLPEVLFVIAILAILLAITIPNFSAYLRAYRAQTAVNEMTLAMNLARQLAVTERDTHVFVITAAPANKWQLLRAGPVTVKEAVFPEGVAITTASSYAWDPNGACTAPTTYTGTTPSTQYIRVQVVISPSRTDRYTIEVSPVGRVKTTREILET